MRRAISTCMLIQRLSVNHGRQFPRHLGSIKRTSIHIRAATRMEKHEIVPDVLDKLPNAILKVKYGTVQVDQGNELTPTQVKDQPAVSWEADPDTFYTLCMTDPDAPSRNDPKFREISHWIVVNIPESDLSKGQVLVEYRGSGPPKGTGLHRYIFLLYKQPGKVNFTESHIPFAERESRRNFKAQKFAQKYSLGQPVAANMYQAQYDSYVDNYSK